MRVKALIEHLEQYPDDALVTILNKEGLTWKLKPLEIVYLKRRNQIVFQEKEKPVESKENG